MISHNITSDICRLEILRIQEEQAHINGAYMEQIGLYDDVCELVKRILTTLISSYGSGTIANFINNCKYTQIDKAVNNTLLFLYHAEPEQLHDLQIDNESIKNLVLACYNGKLKPENYNY